MSSDATLSDNEIAMQVWCESLEQIKTQLIAAKRNRVLVETHISDLKLLLVTRVTQIAELERAGVKRIAVNENEAQLAKKD